MIGPPRSFASRYVRMAGVGLAIVAVAVGLGYFPTLRIGGAPAVPGMFAGAVIALVAGWIGALPACRTGGEPAAQINRMLGATALRMVVAVVLTLVVILAGWFERRSLLLWLVIGYIGTLAGETVLFVRWIKGAASDQPSGPDDAGRQVPK